MNNVFFDGPAVAILMADWSCRLLFPSEVERLFMNYEVLVVQLCKDCLSNGGN